MKIFIATILIAVLFACTTTGKATQASVQLGILNNYILKKDTSFDAAVNYLLIENKSLFEQWFNATKMSIGLAVVPDFSSQWVVAIVLRPTKKVVSIDINKTSVDGTSLKIYYTITDTTSWKTYLQTPVFLATVPKNQDVKQIRFYQKGHREKTLQVHQVIRKLTRKATEE